MPVAEIITIGTEILLGEIVDTNTRYLAINLKDIGIDLYRTMTVGDNPSRIAGAIRESMQRADIIITTGGLGPTIDDPTRQAVAEAVNQQLVFKPELWEQILARFQRYGRHPGENNRRQAFIPELAEAIENPVGTAPAFRVEVNEKVIISLPGVPREMEFLTENSVLPYLRQKYLLKGTIRTRVLHTAAIGESQIDEKIADLEILPNPTVGLSAHPGQIDVRITAKADSIDQVNNLIQEVEQSLRERLGHWVYGADNETLEHAVANLLQKRGWKLVVLEGGSSANLFQRMASEKPVFAGGTVFNEILDSAAINLKLGSLRTELHAEVGLAVHLQPAGDRSILSIYIHSPEGCQETTRSYGGPPLLAAIWAVNMALETFRQSLILEHSPTQGS